LQIALPPDKAQCIMHLRQDPALTSEALRQARCGSPLVSSESPDVIAATALVSFSVRSIWRWIPGGRHVAAPVARLTLKSTPKTRWWT